MKNKIFLTIIFISIFSACGSSKEEEQARLKAAQDSVTNATKLAMDSVAYATKNAVENDFRIKDSTEKANQNKLMMEKTFADSVTYMKRILKSELIERKAKLAAQEENLSKIKEFQIGRSTSERVKQVEDQSLLIEKNKARIVEIEELLNQ